MKKLVLFVIVFFSFSCSQKQNFQERISEAQTKSFTCMEFNDTNYNHIAAGRAIAGGLMNMYAITVGGGDDIGLIGSEWYSVVTTIKETSTGFFKLGNCPTDTIAPVVAITNPINGDTVFGVVEINVNANDDMAIEKVEIYIDNSLLSTDNVSPYKANWDTTSLTGGVYSIKAIAYDAAGNYSEQTIAVSVTLLDNQKPTVEIKYFPYINQHSYPINGIEDVYVEADDNVGVVKVEFLVDGTKFAEDTVEPYVVEIDTRNYNDGDHELKAIAYDEVGNFEEYVLLFKTEQKVNFIKIREPKTGAKIKSNFDLYAEYFGDVSVVDKVQLWKGYHKLGESGLIENSGRFFTETINNNLNATDESGNKVWTTGEHGITVKALDNLGYEIDSQALIIIITETTNPSINIISPTDGANVSGTMDIHVEAVGIIKVEYFVNNQKIGEDSTSPFEFSLESTIIANGSSVIKVVGHSNSGSTIDDTVAVNVYNSTCQEFTDKNIEHVAAGRAVAGGLMNMYATTVGAGDDLGLIGSQYYSIITTIRETSPGYFELGVCE